MSRDVYSDRKVTYEELLSIVENRDKEIELLTKHLDEKEKELVIREEETVQLKSRLLAVEKSQGTISWFIADLDRQKKRVESLIYRLKTVLEMTSDGIMIIAGNGQIIQANKAAEKILSLDRSEIEIRTVLSHVWQLYREDGTELPVTEAPLYFVQYNKKKILDYKMGISVGYGKIKWINMNVYPLFSNGVYEGAISVFNLLEDSENNTNDSQIILAAEDFISDLQLIKEFVQIVKDPENSMENTLTLLPDFFLKKVPNSSSKGLKILYKGMSFESENCPVENSILSKYIYVNGVQSGSIMICYSSKNDLLKSQDDQALDMIASTIGELIEKKKMNLSFQQSSKSLDERVKEKTSDLEAVNIKLQRELNLAANKEKELHESEARIRTLVNKSKQGFVLVGLSYNIIMHNKLANDMTKKISGNSFVKGLDFRNYMAKEDRSHFNLIFEEAIAGKSVSFSQSFRGVDNKVYWYSYDYNPVSTRNGKIIGVCIGILDISEKKELEQNIAESNDYIRSLMEASLNPLVTVDIEGRISDVNNAACEITGKDKEDLIGTDFADYFTNPDKAHETYKEVFNNGLIKDFELEIVSEDGKVIPVLYNASFFKGKSDEIKGVFIALRDISQIKAEQIKREKLITRLEDAVHNIKKLQKLLPICASCKKIRDDKGYWHQVEEYLKENGDLMFSHSICPECAKKLYPDMFENGNNPFEDIKYYEE